MKKILALILLISMMVIPLGGNAEDAEISEGVRLGETKADVIRALAERGIALNEYGIFEDRIADQPFSITELFFLEDLSGFDAAALPDVEARISAESYNTAFSFQKEMTESGFAGQMQEDEETGGQILAQIRAVITSDYKYETATETFGDVEAYLTQKYGETRYTSRRGQSLPAVKAYGDGTYFAVTREIPDLSGPDAYMTVPDYAQRIVEAGDGRWMVIDHHISMTKGAEGYEFTHNLVFTLVPVDISAIKTNTGAGTESAQQPAGEPTPEPAPYPNDIAAGTVVEFGKYPAPGLTPVEWIVLDRAGNNTLLLSKDIIDYRQFNDYDMETGWIASPLRAWLNGTFLKDAFTGKELRAIQPTASGDAVDAVFLISENQLKEYAGKITEYSLTAAESTEYAKHLSAGRSDKGRYWVGKDDDDRYGARFQPYVSEKGETGRAVQTNLVYGIRPAVWVSTAALFGEDTDAAPKYAQATDEIRNGRYANAAIILKTIPDYEDSGTLQTYCRSELYEEALRLQESGQYSEAIARFNILAEYADCSERARECYTGMLKKDYEEAEALMDRGDYREAYEKFELLRKKGYPGAGEMAQKAKDAEEEEKYRKALGLMEEKKYSEALDQLKEIPDYPGTEETTKECIYLWACELTEAGNYAEAYKLFSRIPDYRDVSELIRNNPELAGAASNAYGMVGSIVTFGKYEQDNDESNGAEPVEWYVLDVRDGKSLLMSKSILAVMTFSDSNEVSDWEDSNVRAWLNGAFLESAFSESEKASISETRLENSNGTDTEDHVFLLTYTEYRELSIREDITPAEATEYARATAAGYRGNFKTWWMRSCRPDRDTPYIDAREKVDSSMRISPHGEAGVRPCIWISLGD